MMTTDEAAAFLLAVLGPDAALPTCPVCGTIARDMGEPVHGSTLVRFIECVDGCGGTFTAYLA